MLRDRSADTAAPPRSSVAISFGSPAGERGVARLDLNEILIANPQAVFLMRIAGSSMREAGIDDDDLALVDRSLEPAHGQIVIAVYRDEFFCRRLHRRDALLGLCATDPGVADLWATEDDSFDIWGVVTHVVKQISI